MTEQRNWVIRNVIRKEIVFDNLTQAEAEGYVPGMNDAFPKIKETIYVAEEIKE